MHDFAVGDKVRVTRATTFYVELPAGTTGRVAYASHVSHATANGGGFDITVTLDDAALMGRVHARLAAIAAERKDEPFYQGIKDNPNVIVRSTYLTKEV